MRLEQKYDVAVDRFCWFCDLRLVNRSGHILLGYFIEQPMLADAKVRTESVAEHVFGTMGLTFVIKELFSENYKFLEHIHPYEILLLHEMGERVILDIPDDGSSNRDDKDAKELEIMRQFVAQFPRKTRRRIVKKFRSFQRCRSFEYMMDKFHFIMMQAYLILNGNSGDMHIKAQQGRLSEQDMGYVFKTQSTRALDNTYAHFLDITRGIKGRNICIKIMEAMYMRIDGKIPDTIKKLY